MEIRFKFPADPKLPPVLAEVLLTVLDFEALDRDSNYLVTHYSRGLDIFRVQVWYQTPRYHVYSYAAKIEHFRSGELIDTQTLQADFLPPILRMVEKALPSIVYPDGAPEETASQPEAWIADQMARTARDLGRQINKLQRLHSQLTAERRD